MKKGCGSHPLLLESSDFREGWREDVRKSLCGGFCHNFLESGLSRRDASYPPPLNILEGETFHGTCREVVKGVGGKPAVWTGAVSL